MEPFRDNWAYLKVEMNWLERILLNAVAKARAVEAKTARVTKNQADRVSRDWWMGLMNFEKAIGHDSPAPSPSSKPAQSYQQQLDTRIRLSQAAGISLALPSLCDRYSLSPFEKQTVLLAIAPEVHRRYGELCAYLTGSQGAVGLPTVDLALRLFCRDDQAWRVGRSQLLAGPLMTTGLLVPDLLTSQSFLQHPLKLNPHWVSELLGLDHPIVQVAEKVSPHSSEILPIVQQDRKLPRSVQTQVNRSVTQIKLLKRKSLLQPGGALVGLDGDLKLYGAIAQRLDLQPYQLDLATIDLQDLPSLLNGFSWPQDQSNLLVIRSAQRLLSRNLAWNPVDKVKLIQQIQSRFELTVLDMVHPIALERVWRSWIVDWI